MGRGQGDPVPSAWPQTLKDCVDWATSRLENSDAFFGHGCETPRDEAIWATLHITGRMNDNYDDIATWHISEQQFRDLHTLVEQRITTLKPLAYLVGESWFAGYSFYIDARALVPRSHFGDLIQDGLEPWVQPQKLTGVLDLCCGSGCIAVALALLHPHLTVDAADIDPDALEVADINITRHAVDERVRTIESNLFENLTDRRYDLIVCNPPYIARSECDELPSEYLHEPRQAFEAGDDGLDFVRQILGQADDHLTDDGHLLMELGHYAGALDAAYPKYPFLWLTSRGGESVVVLLSKQELSDGCFDLECAPK